MSKRALQARLRELFEQLAFYKHESPESIRVINEIELEILEITKIISEVLK